MATLAVTRRLDLTDEQWARLDKLAVRYEAILHIAVINDWLLTSL